MNISTEKLIKCALQLSINLSIFIVLFLIFIKFVIFNNLKPVLNYIPKPQKFTYKINKKFVIISLLIFILFVLFQIYLCFPGYADRDSDAFVFGDFAGWQPISIPFTGFIFSLLFGKSICYIFVLNVIVFYFSMFLFSNFLFTYNKSYLSLFTYLSFFIGFIFFNIMLVHNASVIVSFTLLCFILSMYFYKFIVYLDKKSIIIYLIVFTLIYLYTLLIRHNAIFFIFQSYFIVLLAFNKILDKKIFLNYFFKAVAIMGVFSLFFVIALTKATSIFETYPTNHIFLHQIVGTSVISNDYSYIEEEWYADGKNVDDAITAYNNNKLYADVMGFLALPDRPFKFCSTVRFNKLHSNWIKLIFKHPISYIRYLSTFFVAQINSNATEIYDFSREGVVTTGVTNTTWAKPIDFYSDAKKKIYDFVYNCMIKYKTIYEIIFMFIALSISIYKYKKETFLFMLIISLSYFSCFFITNVFTPVGGYTRYAYAYRSFFVMNLCLLINEFICYLKSKIICSN